MTRLTNEFFDKLKEAKQNEDYQKYIENGNSAVIFITKRFVNLDTRRKWIDVLDSNGEKDRDGDFFDFEHFTIEVFQRKQFPDYSSVKEKFSGRRDWYDSEREFQNAVQKAIDYITWETASNDIKSQRQQGIKGTKYTVYLELSNLNEYNEWKSRYRRWNYDKKQKKIV